MNKSEIELQNVQDLINQMPAGEREMCARMVDSLNASIGHPLHGRVFMLAVAYVNCQVAVTTIRLGLVNEDGSVPESYPATRQEENAVIKSVTAQLAKNHAAQREVMGFITETAKEIKKKKGNGADFLQIVPTERDPDQPPIRNDRRQIEARSVGKHKAPWPDFKGNDIFSGSRIRHPANGQTGEVVFYPNPAEPFEQWRVHYDNGEVSYLNLQIGYKGQGVVVNVSRETNEVDKDHSNSDIDN